LVLGVEGSENVFRDLIHAATRILESLEGEAFVRHCCAAFGGMIYGVPTEASFNQAIEQLIDGAAQPEVFFTQRAKH
jgi:hypothetical protein